MSKNKPIVGQLLVAATLAPSFSGEREGHLAHLASRVGAVARFGRINGSPIDVPKPELERPSLIRARAKSKVSPLCQSGTQLTERRHNTTGEQDDDNLILSNKNCPFGWENNKITSTGT